MELPARDALSNAGLAIVVALIGLGAVSVAVLDRLPTVGARDSTG